MNLGHDLVQRWIGMFNAADLAIADEIATDEYVEHALAPFGAAEPGAVHGPAHLRGSAEWLLAQFPDLHMTADAIVAEGDVVAALVTSTGTNLGALNGVIPPTGRSFTARQSHWFRIRDGRLAEHWATRDDLTSMLQLGVLRGPGGRPSAGPGDEREPDVVVAHRG